ncbi:MAG: four helix bundle protein [Spirulina sp.]
MNEVTPITDRTFDFAVRVVNLCKVLDEKPGVARTLSKQLIRSGTSIGANVEESNQFKIAPVFEFLILNFELIKGFIRRIGQGMNVRFFRKMLAMNYDFVYGWCLGWLADSLRCSRRPRHNVAIMLQLRLDFFWE